MQNAIKFALTTKYTVRQINKSWGRNLLTYFNVLSFNCLFLENTRDHRGRDSMLVGFITTMYLYNQCISLLTLWVPILLRRGVLDTTLGDSLSGIPIRSVVLFGFLPHKIEGYDTAEVLTLWVWILLRRGDSLSGISIRSVVLFSFLHHKIERYDIDEILMKVALNTTTSFRKHALMWQSMHLGVLHTWWIFMHCKMFNAENK